MKERLERSGVNVSGLVRRVLVEEAERLEEEELRRRGGGGEARPGDREERVRGLRG